jgi:hypothetical protein
MPQRISASWRPCRTTSKVGGVSKVGNRASVVPTVPIESPYQAAAGIVPLDLGLLRQQDCALDRRPSNSSDALNDIRKPLGVAPHDGVALRGPDRSSRQLGADVGERPPKAYADEAPVTCDEYEALRPRDTRTVAVVSGLQSAAGPAAERDMKRGRPKPPATPRYSPINDQQQPPCLPL